MIRVTRTTLSGGTLALLLACSSSSEQRVNLAPVAAGDAVNATRGAPVQTGNVLANDTDPEGEPLEVIDWTDGASGDVTFLGGGVFVYTPRASAPSGVDSFDYTIIDRGGNLATATVTVSLGAGWGRLEVQDGHYARNRVTGASPPTAYDPAMATPALVEDEDGNVTMAWTSPDLSAVWASRRDRVTGAWITARLDAQGAGKRTLPVLVADRSGGAVAVWSVTGDQADTGGALWASRIAASGAWGPAVQIEARSSGALTLDRALVDAQGTLTVLWRYQSGGRYQLWARRAPPSGPWGEAVQVDTEASGTGVVTLDAAFDRAGNLAVVWAQNDGARGNIWGNRMTAAGLWSTAAKIEIDETNSAGSPQLFMENSGAATAIWLASVSGQAQLWSARMSSSGAWASPIRVDAAGGSLAASAFDPAGSLVLLWGQSDGLWSRALRSGNWAAAAQVSTVYGYGCQLLVDESGNATALWREGRTQTMQIMASRRSLSGAWGAPVRIDLEDLGPVDAKWTSLMDRSGNLAVIWRESDGVRYNLWANRFDVLTSQWGTAAKIETEDLGDVALSWRALIDSSGNLTVLWQQFDGARWNPWANRMAAGGAWGHATVLNERAGNAVYQPSGTSYDDAAAYLRARVDSTGLVTAVWRQDGGERWDLWSARMSPAGAWGAAEKLPALEGPVSRDLFLLLEKDVPVLVGNTFDGADYALWATDWR